jgi:tRNA pseudouridine13 synthase
MSVNGGDEGEATAPNVHGLQYAWMIEFKYFETNAKEPAIEEAFAAAALQVQRYSTDTTLLPMLVGKQELRCGTMVFHRNETTSVSLLAERPARTAYRGAGQSRQKARWQKEPEQKRREPNWFPHVLRRCGKCPSPLYSHPFSCSMASAMSIASTNLPSATIRTTPEDFIVDEIPAYPASGKGEHLFITLRKTGRTTIDVVRELARAFSVDQRGAGYAGMKDRHAITTQTISLQVPMAVDFEPILANVVLNGVEILEAKRHDNKLKPGHLDGNRFQIRLRCSSVDNALFIRAKLEETAKQGAPNFFGPQRFGRDGTNPARALAWLAGTSRGPRDRHEQRLLFSALQSMLFNQVLERRIADGSWTTVLPGDLAKKHDSGGLFLVPLEGPDLEDAKARAATLAISATGPMYGTKMRWPEGAVQTLEHEVLVAVVPDPKRLDDFRAYGEGTRRSLRMEVTEFKAADPDASGMLAVSFVLPKGGYATTVLSTACQLVDATSRPDHATDEDVGTENSDQVQ